MLEHPRCVAVGESGLDTTEGFPDLAVQVPLFEMQLRLAVELQKPLFLHIRGAHEQFLESVREIDAESIAPSSPGEFQVPVAKVLGVPILVHCFTESVAELQEIIDMGCFVSFSGFLCRNKPESKAILDALAAGVVPLDKVMIETDAPYMGFKGCTKGSIYGASSKWYPNPPTSITRVLEKVAEALGLSEEETAAATTRNAKAFFGVR
mmetsp:Transcript_9779/g.36794  ORF Transcript_9779/g.36794 Transcript_9779/m.36794 type:complete len:208 (-) Transcript_9779:339-962(-)